jgi:hypothetical protein
MQMPSTNKTKTTPGGAEVAQNWEKFFRTSENWVFQAAPANQENAGQPSLGSMECMYQAFKARMEAEREQI